MLRKEIGIDQITRVIGMATAPAFLLGAVAGLLAVLIGRFDRLESRIFRLFDRRPGYRFWIPAFSGMTVVRNTLYSALHERQQIRIDDIRMRGQHAVRKTRIELQRTVLHELRRQYACVQDKARPGRRRHAAPARAR